MFRGKSEEAIDILVFMYNKSEVSMLGLFFSVGNGLHDYLELSMVMNLVVK